jgi:hypothetical protein
MKRWMMGLTGLVCMACTAKGEDAPHAPAPAVATPRTAAQTGDELSLPLAIPGTTARLIRFEVAKDIVDHEPVGVSTSFSQQTTPRVFAFLEVNNEAGKPFQLDVAFDPVAEDEVSTLLTLQIPSAKRWRTQVFMHSQTVGKYRAVVVTESGDDLGGRAFEIVD